MTVVELIEALKTFPPDTVVKYRIHQQGIDDYLYVDHPIVSVLDGAILT